MEPYAPDSQRPPLFPCKQPENVYPIMLLPTVPARSFPGNDPQPANGGHMPSYFVGMQRLEVPADPSSHASDQGDRWQQMLQQMLDLFLTEGRNSTVFRGHSYFAHFCPLLGIFDHFCIPLAAKLSGFHFLDRSLQAFEPAPTLKDLVLSIIAAHDVT